MWSVTLFCITVGAAFATVLLCFAMTYLVQCMNIKLRNATEEEEIAMEGGQAIEDGKKEMED